MSNQLRKLSLLMAVLLFFSIKMKAQDVIIKNDKTEIKSKVTEISENSIKYKKWDNLDGPVYDIPKTDVFMIIYENGKTETFGKSKSQEILNKSDQSSSKNNLNSAISSTHTGFDYEDEEKSINVLRIGTTTAFNLVDMEYDWRYKMGKQKDFSLGLGGNITFASYPGLYFYITSAYRLWLSPDKREYPLSIWASVGYASTYPDWNSPPIASGGLWEMGTDIPLDKYGIFGLSVYAPELKSLFFGIHINF